MAKSTAIVPMADMPIDVNSGQFAIMATKNQNIREVLKANLGSDELRPEDLERVTVPGSGGTVWNINTVDGPVETKELVGVVVHTQVTRAYWETSFEMSGGGSPPQCVSRDGLTGVGLPGGDCMACRFNAFESDAKGRGKACQESRLIFIVLQDEILPIVVKAPATSLKGAKKYLLGLTSRNKPVHSVFTKLSLEKDKNADGILYAKIVMSKVGDVENPEATAAYAAGIKPYLENAAQNMAGERNGTTSGMG
jgi:hypothetical protein